MAIEFSTAPYDSVVFEMEHNPWDVRALRDCLQYMLNRKPDRDGGLGRAGGDADRAHSAERRREEPVARQAGPRSRRLRHRLAAHQQTSTQAYNAVAACRYPRLKIGAALRAGGRARRRADTRRCAIGALTQQEYYAARRRLAAQSRRARSS